MLNQTELMNSYLKDYENILLEYSSEKKSIIEQGILVWNIFHDIIYQLKENIKMIGTL